MNRTSAVVIATLGVLTIAGCFGAPRWTTVGALAYPHREPNAALFAGYSGICGSPREAAFKARADAAQNATNYVFQGVQMDLFYTADLRAQQGFDKLPAIVKQSVTEAIYKAFDDPALLADSYTNKQRDRLEVTFDAHHLYQVLRPDFAKIIREAKQPLDLRILRDGPGSTTELRQKFVDQSNGLIESLAQEIQRSW